MQTLRKFMQGSNSVILDTETTGLPYNDETVSITNIAVIDTRGNVLADFLVKPPVHVPDNITALNGLSDKSLADAPSWADIADVIRDVLKDKVVGAWNAPFDRLMVEREMTRVGKTIDCAWVDLMAHYAEATNHGSRYRLAYAAADLGVAEPQEHLALGDCRMTREVLERFLKN